MTRFTGELMRSAIRVAAARRMARVASAGTANWFISTIRSTGMRSNCSLACCIVSWTAPTRAIGSSRSVGNRASRPETRLVHLSVSSPVRIDTGTMATSGALGSASSSSRYRRSAPAQTAITTSLSVTPRRFLIVFT